MREYVKIETLYERSTEGKKTLMRGRFRNPAVEALKDIKWVWTEKVDGTNVRIQWDGHSIHFGGRTEKAQLPVELFERLNQLFNNNETEELFEQLFGEKEVIFFGEGYGHKIQSVGKDYISDGVDFILFDVMIGENYQEQDNVINIAKAFGLKTVPIIGAGTLSEAEDYVMSHPQSMVGTCEMEGLVCRPICELRDRCGNRIIVKIKWKDYKPFVEG